jgi:hypothetical protein
MTDRCDVLTLLCGEGDSAHSNHFYVLDLSGKSPSGFPNGRRVFPVAKAEIHWQDQTFLRRLDCLLFLISLQKQAARLARTYDRRGRSVEIGITYVYNLL